MTDRTDLTDEADALALAFHNGNLSHVTDTLRTAASTDPLRGVMLTATTAARLDDHSREVLARLLADLTA